VIWHMFDGISWYMVYGCWHIIEEHGLRNILVTCWLCDGHAFGILLRHWYMLEEHLWCMV
jgi:hypothetical protein